MGKVITSPVKRYPGTVTLAYPMTYPQYAAWQKAIAGLPKEITIGKTATDDENAQTILPGICACVETWNLAGIGEHLTPETFPASPRISSARLIIWLISEINAIIAEEDESPLS